MGLRREKGIGQGRHALFYAQLEAEVYAYTAQLPRFAAFSQALPSSSRVRVESIG
jgi:hypothetical protein